MNQRLAKQSESFHQALSVLRDNNIQGAAEALQKIPLTVDGKNQQIFDELLTKYLNYVSPVFSLAEWVTAVEKHKYLQHEFEKKRQHWRNLANYEMAVNQSEPEVFAVGHVASKNYDTLLHAPDTSLLALPPSTAIIDHQFHGNRFIIRENEVLYPLDPISLQASKIPLRYPSQPSLSDFTNQIHYFPQTKIINLARTLSSVLDRAAHLGYSKEQL